MQKEGRWASLTGFLLVLNLLLTLIQQEELESVRHIVRTEFYFAVFVQAAPPLREVIPASSCSDKGHDRNFVM